MVYCNDFLKNKNITKYLSDIKKFAKNSGSKGEIFTYKNNPLIQTIKLNKYKKMKEIISLFEKSFENDEDEKNIYGYLLIVFTLRHNMILKSDKIIATYGHQYSDINCYYYYRFINKKIFVIHNMQLDIFYNSYMGWGIEEMLSRIDDYILENFDIIETIKNPRECKNISYMEFNIPPNKILIPGSKLEKEFIERPENYRSTNELINILNNINYIPTYKYKQIQEILINEITNI